MDAIAVPPPGELDGLDDEVFRQVVRQFLRENYPEELRNPPKRLHWDENKRWYFKLAEKGWLCPGWPKEHGGLGLGGGTAPRDGGHGDRVCGPGRSPAAESD